MELGNQIKKYRKELSISQDQLAEKVFVSRQTISNWENDKSYPDVHSLILLSESFDTSIDNLIKGDIDIMKREIREEDKKKFESISNLYAVLLIASIISAYPLLYFLKVFGIVIWVLLFAITMVVAIRVEKYKKQFDIATFKEIVAFYDGKSLDEISKTKQVAVRPYQKVILAVVFGLLALVVFMAFAYFLPIK